MKKNDWKYMEAKDGEKRLLDYNKREKEILDTLRSEDPKRLV
jgi:hypothetical protein